MKRLKTCPICNEDSFNVIFSCRDHSTSKESFTIVSCNGCDFTFTNPRPKEKNLGNTIFLTTTFHIPILIKDFLKPYIK